MGHGVAWRVRWGGCHRGAAPAVGRNAGGWEAWAEGRRWLKMREEGAAGGDVFFGLEGLHFHRPTGG